MMEARELSKVAVPKMLRCQRPHTARWRRSRAGARGRRPASLYGANTAALPGPFSALMRRTGGQLRVWPRFGDRGARRISSCRSRARAIFTSVETWKSFLPRRKFETVALFRSVSQQNCSTVSYESRIRRSTCRRIPPRASSLLLGTMPTVAVGSRP